jgi:glutamine phosphoribosylpyrophosphate amidotransferase
LTEKYTPQTQYCQTRICWKKDVLLVDDSIVRGTTANEIIQMAREAGARKVLLFSSAASPVRYPNTSIIYGIDIPTQQELVAYEREDSEIATKLWCDWVGVPRFLRSGIFHFKLSSTRSTTNTI